MIRNTKLGEDIKNLRVARGLTRAKLAEMIGISESHMNKIEAGARNPGIKTYQLIMNALEADIIARSKEGTV